jgi:hypothetical protein
VSGMRAGKMMGEKPGAVRPSGLESQTKEAEIERLVQNLNSLEEGERTVGTLMAYGRSAIPALRRFLLEGRPSVVYQPRRWAVEALAGIGARDVLIEYLKHKRLLADPAVRFGEEPVENAAARALARWKDDETFQTLLEISRRRSQLGFVEALSRFGRPEAIPYFVHALEDDICRSSAEEALRALGTRTIPALVEAALTRLPSAEEERPASVRRRASALELLSGMELTGDVWRPLRELVGDPHPEVVIGASKIAVRLGNKPDKIATVRRLLDVLPHVDWFAREEIDTCLTSLYPDATEIVEAELARRNSLPDQERVMDNALRTLLRVKRNVDEVNRRG